jgi:ketosteroid isomerase-like protein
MILVLFLHLSQNTVFLTSKIVFFSVDSGHNKVIMKIFLSSCLLLLIECLYGQTAGHVQSLVNAEKVFAQTSKDKSTKEAFSTCMSDSGLIFKPGPILGRKFWQNAEQGTDLLSWEPVFAAISSSGDLGYTTGPWEFRAKRNDPDPVARGYYVSIWKKEKDEWKVALDIGINYPLSLQRKEPPDFSSSPSSIAKAPDEKIAKNALLDKEQKFINEQNKKGWSAYPVFITNGARIYRPGSFPFIAAGQRGQLFSETDKTFSYELTGASVASSGDLGYVYGKAVLAITTDGSMKKLNGNYLRIWKKDEENNWKIVLDLVNITR